MTSPTLDGLLSPSDIADLAGVSRAAVSNWRKRIQDFPKPSGGSANKPLFATSDVKKWLQKHPDKDKVAEGRGSLEREWDSDLWGIANELRASMAADHFGALVLETAASSLQGASLVGFEDVPEKVRESLRSIIEAIPATELARSVDKLLERTSRAQGKSAGSIGFVGSRTSQLLASLASSMKGGTLYDPVCGVGVALLQAVELGAQPDRIVGEDIDVRAIQIAEARATLRGIELEARVGDVILNDTDPSLKADVILAEPPLSLRMAEGTSLIDSRLQFGIPPLRNLDGFWPQHVVSHLADGGVGYILTTPGFLFRRGAESDIRANLLRKGWVRAIVSLPGKMLPYTLTPLSLMVLQQTGGKDVLLIDGSECESPETQVSRWLTDESALSEVPNQLIQVSELIEDDSVLSPSRWVARAPVSAADVQSSYSQDHADLVRSIEELNTLKRELGNPIALTQHQILTMAELIEAGALEVVAAKPVSTYRDTNLKRRVVDAAAIRSQEVPPVDGYEPDEDPALTLPGDVLVSTMNDIQAMVDESGGLIPAGSIYRIRVLDRNALDPYYLAEVVRGDWNLRFAAGSTIPRVPIRDIEVPIIPIADQKSAYAAIADVRKTQELADRVAQGSNALATTMLTALRQGIDLSVSAEWPTK
jgi:hypothetical protein